MSSQIPIEVKRTCCEMKAAGRTSREIYDTYFLPETNSPATFKSFRSMISRWVRRKFADPDTLEAGTYEGFIAHDATVQVSKSGEIIQAWIKQKATDINPEEFIAAIKEIVEPVGECTDA